MLLRSFQAGARPTVTEAKLSLSGATLAGEPATFQSEEYTRREWGKFFEVLEYKVRGIGNHQDAVVLRRPA